MLPPTPNLHGKRLKSIGYTAITLYPVCSLGIYSIFFSETVCTVYLFLIITIVVRFAMPDSVPS